MKYAILFILIFALPMSAVADEIVPVAPVDNNVDLLPGLSTDVNLDASSGLSSCNSDAPGSLGSIGSSALKQLLGSSNLSSILGSIQGGNLNAGNLSGIISTLTGGSQTGQIISSLLNGNVSSLLNSSTLGNIAGNLLGNSGIGNSIGSLLSGGGLSGLGSLAGGPLGLVGGLLGGVPVNDSQVRTYTQKIQGNTEQIQSDQDTQLEVVCVQNVLVRKTSQAFAANYSKTVIDNANNGNGGLPIYSQNIADDNATLSDAVHMDFIKNVLPNSGLDSKLLPEVQSAVDAQYQSDRQGPLKPCPVEGTDAFLKDFSKGSWGMFLNVLVYHPECTPAGAKIAAINQEHIAISTRLDEQTQLTQQAEGILPKIECADVDGANRPLQQCVHYHVVNPASVVNDTLKTGVSAGYQQQSKANDIGDLVDSLFAQLAEQAFTSLKGLGGLSAQNSSGQGSYLDSVVGKSSGTVTTQAKTTLNAKVSGALNTEYAYQAVLADMLGNLGATKDAYSAVHACYKSLAAKGGGTGIDAATATLKMNQASSTILTVLAPQIQSESALLDESEGSSASLEALKSQARTASTPNELNALADAYTGLSAYATLHTTSDLAEITSDRDASKTLLAGMTTDANAELAQCRQY